MNRFNNIQMFGKSENRPNALRTKHTVTCFRLYDYSKPIDRVEVHLPKSKVVTVYVARSYSSTDIFGSKDRLRNRSLNFQSSNLGLLSLLSLEIVSICQETPKSREMLWGGLLHTSAHPRVLTTAGWPLTTEEGRNE